ncbi:MAG: NADH-quinone oxidoreductase subunit J [Chitinophagaceae bacterium]|nr:NADH-quinone oxidoreductase subunit J [Chitinophagaceae bacterium]
MTASQIIFYLIAAFILGSGLLAVTSLKVFRAAIFLLFSLIGIAALYFWMEVEFVAAVQIVVYVGGIVVLIIFSIFLTQHAGSEMPKPGFTRTVASAFAALFGFALTYLLIYQHGFQATEKKFEWNMGMIGSQLLNTGVNGYALPFEVISILLLAAMVGCIVIAIKSKGSIESEKMIES